MAKNSQKETMKLCLNKELLIYGDLRKYLGEILHQLAKQKGVEILEGYLMRDHIHMCLSIPPKYAVSNVVGYIKGKSAIAIARQFNGRQRNFTGEHFWARGYFESTVGLDEDVVRKYIRHQEVKEADDEQRRLF
jgi:putative transposase